VVSFLNWILKKSYDKVNWDFLLECLKIRGFNELWCSWVKQSLFEGTVSVKINNEMGPYFQSAKGVRQGGPLSWTLFNIIAESLAKMVMRAQANNMLVGLAPDLIPNGVAVLQYANDTVLCISHDPEKATNLKLLLYSFELMSRLKINFMKSEIFTIGGDNDIDDFYSHMFGCQVGTLPMKYLGVPISSVSLKTSDWDYVWMANSLKILTPGWKLCILWRKKCSHRCLPLFYSLLSYVHVSL
jgi:hypothetical protein